jgi:A nuclease family of the HNH/ENDO VII superfamily with conserved AHH
MPSLTTAQVGELSAAAVAASGNDPNANPRELMNAQLVNEQKARVLYKNGYTQTAGAATLLANAQRRDYNHRRRLSTSIKAASGQARPAAVCAHHIVALRDDEAARSRLLMFRWGIGINDADNGVFLPSKKVGMPGFPSATHHTSNHSPEYHYEVYVRLSRGSNEAGGRTELKGMQTDLLAGRMSL